MPRFCKTPLVSLTVLLEALFCRVVSDLQGRVGEAREPLPAQRQLEALPPFMSDGIQSTAAARRNG